MIKELKIILAENDEIEATRKIRPLTKLFQSLLKSFALEGVREKAIEAGCNDYFSKTLHETKLL